MKSREKLKEYLKIETVSDKIVLTLLILLSLYFAGSIIYFAIVGRVRDCFISILYYIIAPLYLFAARLFHLKMPLITSFVIVLYMAACSLGASYNFYTIIPCLDDILHAFWGVIFTILGIMIIKAVLGEPQSKKAYLMYMLFGFAFCCMTAALWELFEFISDSLIPSLDQQEDTIVNSIRSFMLYPGYDHYHTEIIEGIAYTQLFDADGNLLYTIEGGYLDIGIIDTMWDMIWCTVASLVFSVALVSEKFAGKGYLDKLLIPCHVREKQEIPEVDQDVCAEA